MIHDTRVTNGKEVTANFQNNLRIAQIIYGKTGHQTFQERGVERWERERESAKLSGFLISALSYFLSSSEDLARYEALFRSDCCTRQPLI